MITKKASLLAIDASSARLSLAVMRRGRRIVEVNRSKSHGASAIIRSIEALIKKERISLKNFDAFVIGSGPGSFTGLRISFSVVKALSLSLSKPVISVGSFFACTYPYRGKFSKIAFIADARRGMIYGAPFKVYNGTLIREKKEALYRLDEFVRKYTRHTFLTYTDFLKKDALECEPSLRFYSKNAGPSATALCEFIQNSGFDIQPTPLEKLEPIYIYPKDCQIKKRGS